MLTAKPFASETVRTKLSKKKKKKRKKPETKLQKTMQKHTQQPEMSIITLQSETIFIEKDCSQMIQA